MPDTEFLFDVQLADQQRFDAMLTELATHVLGQIGYGQDVVAALVRALHGELASGGADGLRHCRVQFHAQPTELEIVVSYTGGRQWRTARPLPER